MFLTNMFPPIKMAPDGGDTGGDSGSSGDDGGSWIDSLPEPVRGWDEVKNSDSPDKFWDQMTNMRSHLGQSIRVPSKEAGEDDWKAFNQKLLAKVPTLMPKPDSTDPDRMADVYKAMGKPDEAGKYAVPEGLKQVKGDALENLQKQAHALHLNNAQFAAMVKEVDAKMVEQQTSATEALEATQAAVKTEWGAAFDKNYEAVTKFLEDTDAPKELIEKAQGKTLDVDTAKWVMTQFNAVKGEGSGAAGDESTGDVITPAEATMQISEILNNKEHAYWNPRDPGHKIAIERMVKLHRLAKGRK